MDAMQFQQHDGGMLPRNVWHIATLRAANASRLWKFCAISGQLRCIFTYAATQGACYAFIPLLLSTWPISWDIVHCIAEQTKLEPIMALLFTYQSTIS